MKLIKLTAISAAVLASTAALAADPVIVVDNNDAVVYEAQPVAYQAAEPSYAYNSDAGIVRNTTGAVVGTTKTLFNTVTNPASVSAEVGSLGYGANVGFSINEKVELQAGWAGGDVADLFGGDFDVEDIEYDVDSDFSNPYLGVQVRPMANWFTMGAGVIVPDNEININANSKDGNYRINDVDYDADAVGTLKGSVKHRNELAPYLTVGFRPNITNNFGVFGELGAAYLGDVNSKVTASNTNAIATEAAAAANAELQNEDYLEWLPIVKLGATYRF
ncbi:hypothetical protein NJD71_08495 [Psychrobacter sp. PP-21]|uniref:hypothetical protein n=1 Tax=Psychrobacter sp. PP-21 TaxID=2957503 RepID=UPI0029BD3216|nr:hypothetical protein [Psychrobacter sp. PP-21]MDX2374167.1 hypothetical protein [Psychrobacter sp. PP-21]